MNGKSKVPLLAYLSVLFCICLVTSNIIAGKLWLAPFGLIFTAGVVVFPIVYIVGDVIPEVYGLVVARKVIWLGFAANLLAVIFFWICLRLTYPPFWQNQPAFEIVLGFTPRLLLASFVGYLIGTNANAWTLTIVKKITKGKYLWARTISSTIVGEFLDSIFFVAIAFWAIMPSQAIINLVISMALFKIVYEIVATPLTYLIVNWVKDQEGITV